MDDCNNQFVIARNTRLHPFEHNTQSTRWRVHVVYPRWGLICWGANKRRWSMKTNKFYIWPLQNPLKLSQRKRETKLNEATAD